MEMKLFQKLSLNNLNVHYSVPPKENCPQQQAAVEPSPVLKEKNITKLHARQQQLAIESHRSTEKVTIDVRYPRKLRRCNRYC